MEPFTLLITTGLVVIGLVCKWLDVSHARRKTERGLLVGRRSQDIRNSWVDIVPRNTCKHPDYSIVPIHSDAFEKNGLVATLCLDCDGQLDAKVWRDKMGRELLAFEKEQAKIELDQKIAASLASDSPETLYDHLESARAKIDHRIRMASMISPHQVDWSAVKAERSVVDTYLDELTRRGLPGDRLLYDPPTKDSVKNELEFESAMLECETHTLRAFGLPDPASVVVQMPIQVKRAPQISFGMASDRNTISREYVPGVRPEGRPQEQYWSEFKAAGFMLKEESPRAFDGSVTQFLYHPKRGVYGVKFPSPRELQRWMEL